MNFGELCTQAEQTIQKVKFYGSLKPKVLFLSDVVIPKGWHDNLRIPSPEAAYIYVDKAKEISEETDKFIYSFIHYLGPEVIVTVGKLSATYFNPKIKIKAEAGKMIAPEFEKKHGKVLCHLMSPGYFKMVPRAKEYKHMENLKFYLMSKYKYGI